MVGKVIPDGDREAMKEENDELRGLLSAAPKWTRRQPSGRGQQLASHSFRAASTKPLKQHWRILLAAAILVALLSACALAPISHLDRAIRARTSNATIEIIDSLGDVGKENSMAVDSNNNIHIAYSDNTKELLKYAVNEGGSWVTSIADSTGRPTGDPSLAVDSNNKVHISYYDVTNYDLKYATNVGGSWTNCTLDSTGWVGFFSSVAVDSHNKIHISYIDYTNDALKYATNAGGTWSTCFIDNKILEGFPPYWRNAGALYTSIAIDSNDKIHISYMTSSTADLRYATNAGGSWTNCTVDSEGYTGHCSSIALDSHDKVHISYYDETSGNLKYATNAGGSWTNCSIDKIGSLSTWTSIAVDSNDHIHISYYTITNGDLRYATNAGGSWATTAVESVGDVSADLAHTSVVVDHLDIVHISYYNYANGDLKYATIAAEIPEFDEGGLPFIVMAMASTLIVLGRRDSLLRTK